jgi:hypothetical protein
LGKRHTIGSMQADLADHLSLSDAANWASLASLIISISSLAASTYAAFGIRRVRQDLINRAMLPALGRAIDEHVASLGKYMQDYTRYKNDFAAELAGCEANLTSVQQKVADTTKVNVASLQWKIARYRGSIPFQKTPGDAEQDARAIYIALRSVQQQLKNYLEERQFG